MIRDSFLIIMNYCRDCCRCLRGKTFATAFRCRSNCTIPSNDVAYMIPGEQLAHFATVTESTIFDLAASCARLTKTTIMYLNSNFARSNIDLCHNYKITVVGYNSTIPELH